MQDNTLKTIYTELIDNINKFNTSNNEDEIKLKTLKQVKKYIKKLKHNLKDYLTQIKQNLNKDKIKPSLEQQTIIDCVSLDNNVYVDAVAGSGKTTVCIFIAKKNKDKNILQITYNKHLKNEVRNKIKACGVENNIEINTYHSLGVKFYTEACKTDDGILQIIKTNMKPKKTNKYDIIIIDESQDMTPIYYEFIIKFMKDMDLDKSISLVMGDRFQSVYQFKNADPRFLTLSKDIWKEKIKLLPLQQSYRVTKQIAYFVNNVMLGYDRIVSVKEGPPVIFYSGNRFACHKSIAKMVLSYISSGYKPDDIFILAPTIKSSNNPVKKLENELVNNNIPVYYSRQEEESLNEEIIAGKVIFTSFHQAKGRERKLVVVFGFDKSYFEFFCRDKNPNECPEELYVAITRASEVLIIIEDSQSGPLQFLKYNHNQMKYDSNIDFIGYAKNNNKETPIQIKQDKNHHETTVSELTKYISEENNKKIIPLIDMLMIKKKEETNVVELPLQIKTSNGLTEDVSDLNGLAIPAIFEQQKTNSCTIFKRTKDLYYSEFYSTKNETIRKMISQIIDNYNSEKYSIEETLTLSNIYVAMNENILSKVKQIDNYNWLNQSMVNNCLKNMKENITGKTIIFEEEMGDIIDGKGSCFKYLSNEYGTIIIRGRIDASDEDTIWEFKCVDSFKREHFLQLIIYAWIYEKSMKEAIGTKKYKILNIRTGELYQLKYESYVVEEIMNILFENKYAVIKKDDDNIFINKCKKIQNKYNGIEENTEEICDENKMIVNKPIIKKIIKTKRIL